MFSTVPYLPLLCEDLFIVQPALLANVAEGDGSQFGGGVALGPGLLLGTQALERLEQRGAEGEFSTRWPTSGEEAPVQ